MNALGALQILMPIGVGMLALVQVVVAIFGCVGLAVLILIKRGLGLYR
jgi:hypothetical protein